MTAKQMATARNIRAEWLDDHSGYDDLSAEILEPTSDGLPAVVVCYASFIGHGKAFGVKSATYRVGVRGGVSE